MAEPNYMSDITGVFGYPVAENPTGVMQNAAFQALGLNWLYLNFEVTAENLAGAVQGMRAMNNFRGASWREARVGYRPGGEREPAQRTVRKIGFE